MIIDCHNHVGVEIGMYLQGAFPYGQHLQDMVVKGRASGVDRWITFPMVTNLSLNIEALRHERCETEGALEAVPYRFENRHLMEEIHQLFPEEGSAVIPVAMFDPGRNTPGQAEELEKLYSEYRFYALKTQPTILQSPITQLNDVGKVFIELAAKWNIPLIIHSSVLPADIWSQAHDIIEIAEANPHVRFCVAHSCRFDVECLDRIAALDNCWFDCSAHGIHCDLAVQDHPVVAGGDKRFKSNYADPGQVLVDLAAAYPKKLMWGSDSPYQSFVATSQGNRLALLSTYEDEVKYFRALSPEMQQLAGCDNTLAWLGIEANEL